MTREEELTAALASLKAVVATLRRHDGDNVERAKAMASEATYLLEDELDLPSSK